jgi:PKD domain/Inosine-uridine preferring nucleoside hydrolase
MPPITMIDNELRRRILQKAAQKPILLLFMLFACALNLSAQLMEKEINGVVKLWIEAEAGSIDSPMRVFGRNDASAGQFVEVESGNNNTEYAPGDGHIVYRFTARHPGIYKVWGRVIASMEDEDAFWVKMDNGEWLMWKNISVGCKWHWDEVHDNGDKDQVVSFNLEEGEHTLRVTYLLDQTRLDKILITNDLDYIPAGMGPGVEAVLETSSEFPLIDERLIFDGSESSSSEGSILAFDWDFGDGRKASGKSVKHSYRKEGCYEVLLIATDDQGLISKTSKKITVYTESPIAIFNFTPDRSRRGDTIVFDASASFDPNGSFLKYDWDFGDGSSGSGAEIKHAYSRAGEYIVSLIVTDSEGKSKKESRLLTVITGVSKKVIFETDMCLDVDDVGALAVLHALANNDEAEILAVCFNEVHPYGASAIDAINTWYGRGDIPVGIYKDTLSAPDFSPYLKALSEFPNDLDHNSVKSALEVYQSVLRDQPDNSVTIISAGFLNNLSELLREDQDLVASKIKELVIMGGVINDGFNLSRHKLVSESENVLENWPSPIVISGSGGVILTGPGLEDSPMENPVRAAYYKFFHNNYCGRPSWDQIAVLYGVRGLSDYFSMDDSGSGALINGYTWQMKAGYRSFIRTLLPKGAYIKVIEGLMMDEPQK